MNYYLIETGNPEEKLRLYKNSRVANYTRDQLNAEAGFNKYSIIDDDTPVNIHRRGGLKPRGLGPVLFHTEN